MKFTAAMAAMGLATACLLLAACAGKPIVDDTPDTSPCLPGSRQCAIYDFGMADEIVLRANGEAIAVDCPEAFAETPVEERQARCASLIRVALSLLSSRFPQELGRIRPEQVRYERAGDCANASASAACSDTLRARVPLPWVVPPPGAAVAPEAGLQ